jgi:BTB/POZ domain-containing protein 13
MYGSLRMKKSTTNWLRVNLLSYLPEHPIKLRELPIDLMKSLIATPELFVMQTEFSVYVLLRLWLFLIFHPTWEGNPQDAVMNSHRFFQDRVEKDKRFFLETEQGAPYAQVFKKLRFNHLVNHHMDMDMLLKDRIIPDKWMNKVYRHQWQVLLRADQGNFLIYFKKKIHFFFFFLIK